MTTSPKRKPAKRGGKKGQQPAKRSRARGPSPAMVAELPVQEGLREMATIGAQTFLWFTTLVVSVAALAAAGYGVWSLRPVPAYSSDGVTIGSAFAATFHVQNTSAWFPLARLKIRCVVDGVDAPEMPSILADTSKVPERLEPGAGATFTCPFHAADPEVALRSELYFRAEYDMPLWDVVRLPDTRGPFIINTRLLPPRWTPKPG